MWQTLITLWLTLSRQAARRTRPASHRSASRPCLELLEDRLAPATLLPLASFGPYANGASPQGGMVEDSHGNLFGTTASGGTSGDGTVFELAAGSGAITTLASFNGANGSDPTGDLVMDSQGNLYGTTYRGGTPNGQNGQQNVQGNQGTVFELANGSNTITDIVSFYSYYNGPYYNGPGEEGYPLGADPLSGLYEDSQGNLFGTTNFGGEDSTGNYLGEGTVFEIANGSHTFFTRATFNAQSLLGTDNGIQPADPPIEDSNGNLFGTTTAGGENDDGTAYEVTASGALITLADFTGPNGENNTATGRLVMDSHGNLFGATHTGGSTWNGSQTSGYGTVFEIANGSNTITTLASFDGLNDFANGYGPEGGLVMDGHGNLFGTTTARGAYGAGTVFEVANGTNTITTLASFNATNGALPIGDLILDGNGNLFGVTSEGGATGSGTVFEVEAGISPFGDVSLQAPDVTSINAAQENPYTFSLAFHDETLVNYQSVLAATIQVQPPTGPALTAQLQGIVASNPDASGNSANLTAVYQITPPGGSWSAAPAGTYSVVLSGSPVTDLAGYAAPLGAVGTFHVVSAAPTSTSVASDHAAGSVYGQQVTFTATVSSSGASPTGSVQFLIDGSDAGSPMPLSGGAATFSTSSLSAATHAVTAVYTSDSPFFSNSQTASPFNQSVAPAPLAITATTFTKTYDGDATASAVPTVSGLQNGDTVTGLSEAFASKDVNGTNGSVLVVTGYTVNDGNGGADYTVTLNTASGAITPATLTVTANDATRVYGQANPSFTDAITGFVQGDDSSVVSGAASLSTTATAASGVGPYTITAAQGTLSAADYTFAFIPGTLTVTPAALTITADNQTKVYGAPLPALTASYSGFVNGDTPASLITPPVLSTTATAASHVTAGGYPITAAGAVAANYAITYVAGVLTITPAPLTITADDQIGVSGAALPTLTASYAGLVNGDTPASLPTPPTLNTTATAASPPGQYPITAAGAADPDYTIGYGSGSLFLVAADAGGPYNIAEGDSLTLDATEGGSDSLPLTYTWAINGTADAASGASPTLTWPQLQALGIDDGPNSFAVSLIAADAGGQSATSVGVINLANTPPTASLAGPTAGVAFQPLTFTLTAADPSATDQAAGFTYVVSWGDGGSTTVKGLSGITATHQYSAAGNFTVTMTATDKDGGVSQAVSQAVSVSATPQLENGVLAIPGTATPATITLTPTLPTGAAAYSMTVKRTIGTTTTNLGTFAVPSGIIEVYGGPGTDAVTLNGTANNDAFTIGNGTVGELAAQNTAQATAFSVVLNAVPALTLKGDGGSDSLTGPNQANTWDLTAANAGTLDNTIAFSSIQNLTGGSAADTFAFTTGTASVSGLIDGGGGANTLDLSGRTTAVTVTMVAGGPNKATATGGWTNIGTVIGGAATNTLVGANTANVWNVTGANAGTLDGALTFSGFQNLTGGSVDDTFVFLPGGSLAGNLKAGAPTNTLDFSQYGSPVAVNLAAKTATGIGGTWANIQVFDGTRTTDTLIGPNANSTWSLTGFDAGAVGGVSFTGFANLTGGTGNDVFKFAAGASVSGVIDGGAGTNALDYSLYTSGVYVNLQTQAATGTAGVANIQNVTGSAVGGDILVGNGGSNVLTEHAGDNLVIGGGGADTLIGGSGSDILIAGSTIYDQNVAALDALLAAWDDTTLSYSQRVADLLSGVSYTDGAGTHTAALDADSTVSQPTGSGPSTLIGGSSGLDWFFAAVTDVVKNQKKGEIVSTL